MSSSIGVFDLHAAPDFLRYFLGVKIAAWGQQVRSKGPGRLAAFKVENYVQAPQAIQLEYGRLRFSGKPRFLNRSRKAVFIWGLLNGQRPLRFGGALSVYHQGLRFGVIVLASTHSLAVSTATAASGSRHPHQMALPNSSFMGARRPVRFSTSRILFDNRVDQQFHIGHRRGQQADIAKIIALRLPIASR